MQQLQWVHNTTNKGIVLSTAYKLYLGDEKRMIQALLETDMHSLKLGEILVGSLIELRRAHQWQKRSGLP